jgi:hypothetical protein
VITELDSNDINFLFQNVTVGEKLKFQKVLKKHIASVSVVEKRPTATNMLWRHAPMKMNQTTTINHPVTAVTSHKKCATTNGAKTSKKLD